MYLMYVDESGDCGLTNSPSPYFEAADLAAFLLYQHLAPNAYMRRNSGQNFFQRLTPILCLHATPKDPYGIVGL